MLKAVIFDIDGVLLDSQPANTKYIQDFITSEGYPTPSVEETIRHTHLNIKDMVRQFTKETDEEKIHDLWGKAVVFPYNSDLLKIPSGAHETVEALKEKYSLGIVTNRLQNHTDIFFQKYGLPDDFTVVVTMSDITNPKPDPEPILLAIEKLGVLPEEAVYIGDTWSDLKAAKSAGAKFIMVNNTEVQDADAYVVSLSELPEVIAKL